MNQNADFMLHHVATDFPLFSMVRTCARLPAIYNSILPVWQQYAAMRADFNNLTSITIDMSAGVGASTFPSNSPAAIRFFEANQLAEQLIERAIRDEKDASEVLASLIGVLNDKVGTGVKIEQKVPGEPHLANP